MKSSISYFITKNCQFEFQGRPNICGCLNVFISMLEHKKVEESDGNDSEDSDEDFFDCRETLSLRSRTASIPSVESDGGKV